jgi:WS/DGAT/MGAT family acyltransferase
MPGTMPRTRFNAPCGPHRVFDGVSLDFDEVKLIRKAVPGATVNDVILSAVGGALRRYLEDKGELPEESLVAMAPISVRTKEQSGAMGNQVSFMLASLGTDVADPLKRTQHVFESTTNSKEVVNAVGARLLTDYSRFIPSAVSGLAARLYTRTGLANRHNPIFNTVVTNVPGPQQPLYFCGAELVSYYGIGPIFDGMALIHAVLSYHGTITVSATCDRAAMPDPARYADDLRTSFDELVDAAGGSA